MADHPSEDETLDKLSQNRVQTPQPLAPASQGTWIPERRAFRKPRRQASGISYLEAASSTNDVDDLDDGDTESKLPAKRRGGLTADDGNQRTRMSLAKRARRDDVDIEATLERLASSFAEDYWLSPKCAKPLSATLLLQLLQRMNAQNAKQSELGNSKPTPVADILLQVQKGWLRRLQLGFSLLVHGIGSKRTLLERFADDALLTTGAFVARFDAFDVKGSLPGFLKELLCHAYPGQARVGNSSPESLAAAVRTAQATLSEPRPLALVVHNIELLPVAHQAALAAMASIPDVFLITSVDNIMAPLGWTADMLKSFNFCREEVNTCLPYTVEISKRYPDGFPAWCDPSADRQQSSKASIALVLRSLTNNHRELCEVIAKHQLQDEGRAGISMGNLLTVAADRMIASNIPKLRSLLNELKDHEVVTQKTGSDGTTLIWLPCKDETLKKLAEGQMPTDSDNEGQDPKEDDEEDEEDGEESVEE